MPTHYETLGVSRWAKTRAITRAYHALSLVCHPDKPGGSTVRFQAIQTAYEVLNDADKRAAYDNANSLAPLNSPFMRYTEEGLPFTLPAQLNELNHYEYYNQLFDLRGDDRIAPGRVPNSDELSDKAEYVQDTIVNQMHALPAWDWGRYRVLKAHLDKLHHLRRDILNGILSSLVDTRIYNLSLGHFTSEEDGSFVQALGGLSVLQAAVKEDPYLFFSTESFSLYEAGILNPRNFKIILQAPISFGVRLSHLHRAHLLTQENFDFLLKHITFSSELRSLIYMLKAGRLDNATDGMRRLEKANLLTQKNFEHMVHVESRAGDVAGSLIALQAFNLHTDETEHTAVHLITCDNLGEHLKKIRKELKDEEVAALHWTPPAPWEAVGKHLNQLFAHGLYVLSENQTQGEAAMLLALALKSDLYQFTQLTETEQDVQKETFKHGFITTLHAQDALMNVHRAQWKVLVANVLIALTGVGLFALGVNYLLTKHCFFAKTTREQYLDRIEAAPCLQ